MIRLPDGVQRPSSPAARGRFSGKPRVRAAASSGHLTAPIYHTLTPGNCGADVPGTQEVLAAKRGREY